MAYGNWATEKKEKKLGQGYRIRLAGSFASQSGLARTKERKVSSKIESRERERERIIVGLDWAPPVGAAVAKSEVQSVED